MGAPARSIPLGVPRGGRRVIIEAFSQTEKVIALCRVLMISAALAVIMLDPRQPSVRADLAYAILGAYLAYSLALYFLVRGEYVRQEPAPFRSAIVGAPHVGPWSLAADVLWITLISVCTEGGPGPFFLLHLFVVSSVSVRWGLRATMAVTVALAVLYPTALLASQWIGGEDLGVRRALFLRPAYLLILGYLIGYPGEHERQSRRKLHFMLDLSEAFRRARRPGLAIARLMRRTLDYFEAERGLLVLRDPESGRFFTWDVSRRGGRVRLGLRISATDPLSLRFASGAEGFLANDLRPGTGSAVCWDVLSGAMTRRTIPADLVVPGREPKQSVMAAPVIIQRERRGRALIFSGPGHKFSRDDLEFLLLLVAQAAAGFENVRLQEKAEEVAVLEERARIARDLHDGFIQSLAGIDLRIEACKLLLQRDLPRVPRELEELHQAVDRGYKEVRRYLTVLRTAGQLANDLWSGLDRLAAEFSLREGLHVHLERPSAAPTVPATTGYELTQIVREALRNAVRHGRATQAVVKVAVRSTHLALVVRDNGTGFESGLANVDADGFLAHEATPWSIRERTAALGGQLRVRTEAGRGAEVSVIIPSGQQADGGNGFERRMHA